jgi:Flavoprotein
MMDSNDDKTKTPHHPRRRRSRSRLLLGVTGSVAAVKAPELAIRFSKEYQMDVCILLTRGGRNFWDKAREYDKLSWDQVQQRIVEFSGRKHNNTMIEETSTKNNTAEDPNDQGDSDQGTIQLHGEHYCSV